MPTPPSFFENASTPDATHHEDSDSSEEFNADINKSKLFTQPNLNYLLRHFNLAQKSADLLDSWLNGN